MKHAIYSIGLMLALIGSGWATTYSTPTLDGDLTDWAGDELIDANDCNACGVGQFAYALYVTWDATNLYVGVGRRSTGRYLGDTAWTDDSFFVAIDTDQTNGSGATDDPSDEDFNKTITFGDPNSLPDYFYAFAGGGGWFKRYNWTGSAWNPIGWTNAGTYYGWNNPNNYNDELTIPWSEIGSPSTIRLYAYMTREQNDWIEDVWPMRNPNGAGPALWSYYEFSNLGPGVSPDREVGQDGVSSNMVTVHFAVDTDNGQPFGLPGSGVFLEELLDPSKDDFYQWTPPNVNVQTIDESAPGLQIGTPTTVITNALDFNNSPLDLTISEVMHDDLGILFWVQFTVGPTSTGLAGTDVRFEANKNPSEEGGDVFECPGNGAGMVAGSQGNSLLIDETPLGLSTVPENDANALVVNEDISTLPMVDTDGVGGADTPVVFYSIKGGGMPAHHDSDDIAMTAPFGGYPLTAWTATELGLGGVGPNANDIDALFIDASGDVFFSLAAGSPMLAGAPGSTGAPIQNWFTGSPGFGADPGDIIAVTPAPSGSGVPPASPPMVVITATMLGLFGNGALDFGFGEDDLNGLHMTMDMLPVRCWELY